MTRAEAERWAAGSVFRAPVFHVTTVEAAASIRLHGFDLSRRAGGRAWGNGVYAAVDRATRDRYMEHLGRFGVTLPVRVDVRRVLTIRIGPTSGLPPVMQLLSVVPAGLRRFIDAGLVAPDRATALTRVLLDEGYDAVEIREDRFSASVGGNQVVVFDPRRVVVVNDDEE
jgi:hypothetical protein